MKHRSTAKWSPAYQVGQSIAFATACQKGHTGFSPSTTDRVDWGHD